MTIQQNIINANQATPVELPESTLQGEFVEDVCNDFFAPAPTDAVDRLIARYREEAANVLTVGEFVQSHAYRSALHHFIAGNTEGSLAVRGDMYSVEGALGHLNGVYWRELLQMTDVFDYMPYARKVEWEEQITGGKAPAFEESTVRSTLQTMLTQRSIFFAERVDGVFRALSQTHLTNNPAGFASRFIIDYAESKAGYISDLRVVISRFMGHPETPTGNGSKLLRMLSKRTGEWHFVDGAALRMKMFKVGTCHVEVHPEIAARLNSLLALLYPTAIPSRFRTRPTRPPKEFPVLSRSLPQAVISILCEPKRPGEINYRRVTENPNSVVFYADSPHVDEAYRVLEALGGVRHNKNRYVWFEFDYDPLPAIEQVAISGLVPDDKSHQFYPTRERMADLAAELADIQDEHDCLEPSAGNGALAARMPLERTTCVEIAPMRCAVLSSKGYRTVQADFLVWASKTSERFDRIVLNPPFANNRATMHLQAAAGLLRQQGRLVAILPASLRGKDLVPDWDWDLEWHGPFENQFDGTNVQVCILVAQRRTS